MSLLLADALRDPKLKSAVVALITALCHDPEVLKMVSELTVKIMSQPEVAQVSLLHRRVLYDIHILLIMPYYPHDDDSILSKYRYMAPTVA